MLVVLALIAILALGIGAGLVLAAARRRLDAVAREPVPVRVRSARPVDPEPAHMDEEPAPSMLGTPQLRLTAIRLGAGTALAGVALLAMGAHFVGEMLWLIGTMVAAQTLILGAISWIREGRAGAARP